MAGLSRELVRQDHEVDLVTMNFKDPAREENVDGVRLHRVPCLRRSMAVSYSHELLSYVAAAAPRVRSLVRERSYDINHTHFILPDGVVAAAVKKLTGLPFVVTAHGSDVPGYNPDRFILHHRLLAPLWRVVTQSAAAIVCPSAALEAAPGKRHLVTFRDPRTAADWKIEQDLPSLSRAQVMLNRLYEDNVLVRQAIRRADGVFCAAKHLIPKVMRKYGLASEPAFLPTPVPVPRRVCKGGGRRSAFWRGGTAASGPSCSSSWRGSSPKSSSSPPANHATLPTTKR